MVNFRVKIILSLLQLLALAIIPLNAAAQSPSSPKEIFSKAETYFLYEEYDLANQLYLLIDTPDNMNIKYKIGTCYLNIPGEKEKSITYLEKAVTTASYDAKTTSFKEMRPPLDAYFSLAKAYMINDQLDKGLSTLITFKKLVLGTNIEKGMKNQAFIDQEIEACKNAIEFRKNPVEFSKRQMGNGFNQGSVNDNPAVSFDGNKIVYTERRGIVNAIFYSQKERGKWIEPINITAELNAGEDCASSSLNSDGTQLFLYKTDNYDGSIYSSNYVNGAWTPIKKLNRNINSKFYESHASISSDGKKLYFTSNRDGGQGNLDIYVSEKDASGDWGPAVNLGAAVNTQYNEDNPFITRNDSLLYFSSEGHNTMGGYDIFYSLKVGSVWKPPTNIGYPISTGDDDKFFQPLHNGRNAYYSMPTAYKKRDIFYLGIGTPDLNQLFEITGKVSLSDTILTFDEDFKIHLLDKQTGDTADVGYPNKYTGLYSFYVQPKSYELVFTGPGYFPQTVDTAIMFDSPDLSININATLERDISYIRTPRFYEKLNPSEFPALSEVDTTLLITNMSVSDINDKNISDSDILYYTVQVMALYHPVDVSYFKYIPDIRVMYSSNDKFYRYTTGIFFTKDQAYVLRTDLINKGYPDDIFIKKVSKR